MMKQTLRVLMAALLVMSAACGSKNDGGAQEPTAIPAGPDGWMYDVPADAAFVIANYKPMPQEVVDWMAQGMAPIAAFMQKAIDEAKAEASEDEAALLAEIDGKLSREGLAELGIKLNSRFAIYNIGPSLAIRFELADGAKFQAFLDRVIAAVPDASDISRAELGGVSYLRVTDDDEPLVVLAVHEDVLYFGFMHVNAESVVLPVLFGQSRPAQSVGSLGTLREQVANHQLLGISPGYFDTRALIQMLTGRGSELSQAIIAASGFDFSEMSTPACQKDFDGLAEIAPHLSFGYRRAEAGIFDTFSLLEMRADIASELAVMQAPIYGLDDVAQTRPMFALGLGIDVEKFLGWVVGKARGVQQAPFECALLAEFNQAMAEIEDGANSAVNSLRPMAPGLRGLSLLVSEVSMGGFLPSGAGYAMLSVSQPASLIEMARAFVPQLAEVQVTAGGGPVQINTGVPGLNPVHMAVEGSWLGASLGAGMKDRMMSALKGEPDANGPFAIVAYDYAKIMKTMAEAGEMPTQDPETQMIMDAVINMFGFSWSSFRFEERGLVMMQSIQGSAQ